ncbi:MAG: Large-conductance mechanosensitive channel, partial [uncultured Friedmanniella sp.]
AGFQGLPHAGEPDRAGCRLHHGHRVRLRRRGLHHDRARPPRPGRAGGGSERPGGERHQRRQVRHGADHLRADGRGALLLRRRALQPAGRDPSAGRAREGRVQRGPARRDPRPAPRAEPRL